MKAASEPRCQRGGWGGNDCWGARECRSHLRAASDGEYRVCIGYLEFCDLTKFTWTICLFLTNM